jgi:hypothetical protein
VALAKNLCSKLVAKAEFGCLSLFPNLKVGVSHTQVIAAYKEKPLKFQVLEN